ncbi:MAG: type VI secretion system baseplate subunit TssF [Gemmatimonadota bacterium]|jgi:type VI secretion system protein ImpG
MRDELLHYYERELGFLRQTGAEFARRYPKVAGRLLLEPTKCDDPHVERLLEGFAFLAARVHLRIDEDFPELSEALLSILYPSYVQPTPSMSLVQFQLDPEQGKLSTGLEIPRDTSLYSRPVDGAPCRFRTCYDTTLWPLEVVDAAWTVPQALDPPVRSMESPYALRMELRCFPDVTFESLEMDRLRLHIRAESALASTLYEVLLNNTVAILVREPGSRSDTVWLPATALKPVGFGERETLLPPPRRSFLGYNYLHDYFSFPEKYLFLDLTGLERLRKAGFGRGAEVIFLISSFERQERRQLLEPGVGDETFKLGCTPIVNLFEKTSEPILLNQKRPDYILVADARRQATTGVYSVGDITVVSPGRESTVRFAPFYSHRHGANGSGPSNYWIARRRYSKWREGASDVVLSFVDLSGRTVYPDEDAATARLLCFNGDLPSRLPFGSEEGEFEMPGGGPVGGILTMLKPTPSVEPPLGKPRLWRLISQLSLNFISLVEGGADALQETLRLHNQGESVAGEQQIRGIESVTSSPTYARIESAHGLTFARGHRVEVEFDESRFAGGGVYLMASVLERFLGLYVSLNSFNVLSVRSRQRQKRIAEWPPRSGWKTLL